jgi:hypothetical protein
MAGDYEIQDLVTQAEFARMLGVSRPYICKLVKRGTIALSPDGKVPVQAAAAAIGKQIGPKRSGEPAATPAAADGLTGYPVRGRGGVRRPAAEPGPSGATEATTPPLPPPPAPPGDAGQGVLPLGDMTYIQAKTFSEHLKGLLSHLKYQESIGVLVDAVQVRHQAFEMARRTRDALLAIAERVAPVLAAETDPAKIHEVLVREVRQACEELAAGLKLPGRPGPEGIQ